MNTKKVLFIGVIVLIILVAIVAILSFNKKEIINSKKIKVVTTLFPLYDFTKEIGGGKVDVTLLLPPGVEAHSYEPKPSDILKINESNIFVYTGEFMEPWAGDVIKGFSSRDIIIVDSSLGVIKKEGDGHDHDENHNHDEHDDEEGYVHSEVDPHIWLDFDNNKIMVDNILNALINADPENKDFYQNNALVYKEKLDNLNNEYKLTLGDCKNKKIIYGGHYAFGYLSQKYNLNYESAYGMSPNSEPLARDLIRLVEYIKNDNIKYIFSEELLNPKVVETLAKETGVDILSLNTAENIKKEEYLKGTTFLSIMEENLFNLSLGLSCQK